MGNFSCLLQVVELNCEVICSVNQNSSRTLRLCFLLCLVCMNRIYLYLQRSYFTLCDTKIMEQFPVSSPAVKLLWDCRNSATFRGKKNRSRVKDHVGLTQAFSYFVGTFTADSLLMFLLCSTAPLPCCWASSKPCSSSLVPRLPHCPTCHAAQASVPVLGMGSRDLPGPKCTFMAPASPPSPLICP